MRDLLALVEPRLAGADGVVHAGAVEPIGADRREPAERRTGRDQDRARRQLRTVGEACTIL